MKKVHLACQYFLNGNLEEDNLDYLALKYYNNPTYWWIIAYFNRINDPFIRLAAKYTVIKIPSISSIKFQNER